MRGRKFGRMPNHRKILIQNLATSLVEHERITTTIAKAKEMRPLVEKLIHKAKRNSHEDKIYIFKTLKNRTAIKRLSEIIAPRFGSLQAGYSRIEFIGRRTNDKSQTAMIELIGNP